MSSIPTTTQQYTLTKVGDYKNLKKAEATIAKTKANEVLVKVHAVSLQYRDLSMANGIYDVGHNGVVPCSDMAGEIIAVGEDVKKWTQGARVCANFSTDHLFGDTNADIIQTSLGAQSDGVLTQYRNFPAHCLVAIPEHLSYEEASTLPCAALTAYNALRGPVPIKAGDTVLVLGTGGVSIFALQFAVASGATVIATSSSNEKLAEATKLGARHTINYKTLPKWDEEVKKLTNQVGVDFVIEVGGQGTLPRSLNAVRIGGSVAVIGFLSKDTSNLDFVLPVIMKSILVRGVYIGPVTEFINMNRLIEANPEKTRPVINKVFNFDQAVDAYAYLKSQQHVGKIVIKVA